MPRSSDDSLDPTGLETATFPLTRRGFDPSAVRARFKLVATALRDQQGELQRLRSLESEALEVGDQLEAHRIAEALGAEATRVIEAAHHAASERAERAEREALAVRDEAIAAADLTRTTATTEAQDIVERAKRDAEALTEDGRAHGRHMVAEAQAVRERMLSDLSRKRQMGRAQVEQLRAARDRLLESLAVVQQSLDTAMFDLASSVPEARAAAERAGLRIKDEMVPTAQQLESEIEAAHLVGHPLVEGIADPGPEPMFDTGEVESLAQLDSLVEVVDDRPEFFDAEVEDQTEADVEPEVAEPEPEPDPDPELEAEPESQEELAGEEVDADGVDDLFAKLRSSSADNEVEADEIEDESDESDHGAASDETEPEDEPVDESSTIHNEAVARTARVLKKVVVDEQGALLDGIRRIGVEALREIVEDSEGHLATYDDVAIPELESYAVQTGSDNVSDLFGALAQIHSISIDPIRHRLSEFVRRSDKGDEPDAGEMTDAVRAIYRESRSRRVPDAAAAAIIAVDALCVIAQSPEKVRWMVDPTGPCGSDCADNALAGEVETGEAFPTGHTHPPVHVACTCKLVPVTT